MFSQAFNAETKARKVRLFRKADKKSNDQESIQSNSTSCPKHQTGKGHIN